MVSWELEGDVCWGGGGAEGSGEASARVGGIDIFVGGCCLSLS